MASFSVKESDLREILPANTLKTRVPQAEVDARSAPAPPRYRNEIAKYIIRRSHDCMRCGKCAAALSLRRARPQARLQVLLPSRKSYQCIGPACEKTDHYCVAALSASRPCGSSRTR